MNNLDFVKIYTEFLESHISLTKPLKIVADCSNGTEGKTLEYLIKSGIPNLEIIPLNDKPDPDFSAHGPNPLIPGATDEAAKKVVETGADFGVIFDADADRAFFVDDKGETLPSFMIAYLLFKKHTPPFVADEIVYNSLDHMKLLKKDELIPSRVGTRYVKEVLKEKNASVAAEFSGHYYFKDFFGSDSGIFAMIKVAHVVSELPQKLSDFVALLPRQFISNEDITLKNKTWQAIEPHVRTYAEETGATIYTREGITLDFGSSWLTIRTSNTEPVLRLYAGGDDTATIAALIEKIKSLV